MSAITSKDSEDKSLLEDASTLLMFSKARSDSNSNKTSRSKDFSGHNSFQGSARSSVSSTRNEGSEQVNNHFQSLPLSRTNTGSGTISPRNPLASPGPASVALLEEENNEDKTHNTVPSTSKGHNNTGNNGNNSSNKGMVAAAALAAAATVPLPLKTRGKRKNSQDTAEYKRENEDKRRFSSKKTEWPVPDSYIVDLDSGVISCICGFNDDDGFTIQCDHCNRWQHAVCYDIKDIDAAPEEYLCNVCDPRKIDVKRAKRQQLERMRYSRGQNYNSSTSSNTQLLDDRIANSDDDANDVKGNNNRGTNMNNNNDNNNYNTTINNDNTYGYKNDSNNGGVSGRGDSDSSPSGESPNGISEDERKRRRRRDDEISPSEAPKKKKENVTYMTAKEAYLATYLSLESCEYRDKYVKLFIDKHNDDDWVIPYNRKTLKSTPLEIKPYSEIGNAKIFPGFTKLGVYLSEGCEKNDFISEFLGEVYFQKDYLSDPRNHYRIWGATKPRVVFHPHWPLCIDARLSGNVTRYARRSCNPNVELATVKMPTTGEVKFLLRATRKIESGEEIQMNWQWDLRHPILQIINDTTTLDLLNDPDKYLLIHSVHTILGSCDCACGNNKDCSLFKVKKFSQNLYKSVKSKMNNRYKLNEILNQYQGKRRRPPPILTRLSQEAALNQEKATKLLASLSSDKLAFVETNGGPSGSVDNQMVDSESKSRSDPGVKPYKWILLEKDRRNGGPLESYETPAKQDVITNPSEYDESQVDDLESLPIPIVLEVPIKKDPATNEISLDSPTNYTTDTNQSNFKDTSASAPMLSAVAVEKPSQSMINASHLGQPSCRVSRLDDKSTSSSAASLSDLPEHAIKPLKKKLSFADYRKKQSK